MTAAAGAELGAASHSSAHPTDATEPAPRTRGAVALRLASLMRRLARLASWWPTTLRGLLTATLSGIALRIYGYGSLDLILYVVGLSGLVLVSVAAIAVLGAALRLKSQLRSRHSEESRFECGSPIRTFLTVPTLPRIPLVQVGWTWVSPRNVTVKPRLLGTQLHEEVIAHRRDLRPRIVRRFRVGDAFGLARWEWDATEVREVLLLPEARTLRHAAFVPSLASADGTSSPAGDAVGDRMEIRPYVAGDSVRNIVWTTYARTGQLVVRMPERSVDRAREVRAYLVAGAHDEPAAAAARVAIEEGALGDNWSFGADGTDGAHTEREPALRAIARSGGVAAAEGGRGLGAFARGASGAAHCIVFAGGSFGAWTEHVLALLAERPHAVSVVIGIDGFPMTSAPPTWRRLLIAEPAARGAGAMDHPKRLVATLQRAGAHVVVADRTTGRYYGDQASLAQGAGG